MIASQRGGMSIEDVAKETPEEIFKEPINISKGILPEQAERIAKNLGFLENSMETVSVTLGEDGGVDMRNNQTNKQTKNRPSSKS